MKKQKSRLVILLSFILLLFTGCQVDGKNLLNARGSEKEGSQTTEVYTVAFADRYDRSTLPFELVYQNDSNVLFPNDIVSILKTKDELVSLCQDNQYPFFDADNENFDRKLSRAIRSYDKSYFEDKALVFILLSQNNDFLSQIDRIEIEQDILTVYISNPKEIQDRDNSTMEKSACIYIIEMEKRSTENIDTAKIQLIQKGSTVEYENGSIYSEFYTLDYAYDRGLITQNDVRSIAFYYHSGKEWMGEDDSVKVKEWEDFIETDYQPIEQDPKELNEKTIDKIKTTYVEMINSSIKYYYEKEGISIRTEIITEKNINNVQYLGTYNGYAAVVVKASEMSFQQVTTPTIAGVTFYYVNSGETVLLFQEGK